MPKTSLAIAIVVTAVDGPSISSSCSAPRRIWKVFLQTSVFLEARAPLEIVKIEHKENSGRRKKICALIQEQSLTKNLTKSDIFIMSPRSKRSAVSAIYQLRHGGWVRNLASSRYKTACDDIGGFVPCT